MLDSSRTFTFLFVDSHDQRQEMMADARLTIIQVHHMMMVVYLILNQQLATTIESLTFDSFRKRLVLGLNIEVVYLMTVKEVCRQKVQHSGTKSHFQVCSKSALK